MRGWKVGDDEFSIVTSSDPSSAYLQVGSSSKCKKSPDDME